MLSEATLLSGARSFAALGMTLYDLYLIFL